MNLEHFITVLISIHAIAGTIALCAGTISIIVKKGGIWHKKAGRVFYINMLILGFLALVISWMPGHRNYFLFVIGVFSMYLVLSGNNALKYKYLKNQRDLVWDKIISAVMLFFGLVMLGLGSYIALQDNQMGYVLIVFGLFGIIRAVQDFIAYRNLVALKQKWLKHHIGKMSGGFIAAFTAFIVVNDVFPTLLNWFLPTVPGTLFIVYWQRKVSPKKKKIKKEISANSA
jgi:uncharacterized membrane protein